VDALGEVFRTLAVRGFHPIAIKTKGRARSFEGKLRCAQGDVLARVEISDWDFLTYPNIRVLEKPAFLPSLMPHIDVFGSLCYFAPGSVTLDRYNPAVSLLQCLNQATDILNRIALDPTYRREDIQTEFPALWAFGQAKLPWRVLIGDIGGGNVKAGFYLIEVNEQKYALISSNLSEANALAKALGAKITSSSYRCGIFESAIVPYVPEKMPSTVKDLFNWLKSWDKSLYDRMQEALLDDKYLGIQEYVTFGIKSPAGWIGFGFYLDRMKRLGYQKRPERYRQFLHAKGGAQELFRMAIEPIGTDFTHSRNLSYSDMKNKSVTVVGCGSIGSYIANAMARLGAGTGERGQLKLIDPDSLGAENLGRHTLGYPFLFQGKASGMRDEIRRHFAYANIVAVDESAFDDPELFACDLLIDATGEESVSERLNGLRLSLERGPPILHVWIRGNGDAVQALWVDERKYGCYRCLIVPDRLHHRRERFRLLKQDTQRRTDGCRSYTPYAVSASMYAGALAAEMVGAWLQGSPSPRFRTHAIRPAVVHTVANQDMEKMKGCPACNPI